jgi:hypothetical protein
MSEADALPSPQETNDKSDALPRLKAKNNNKKKESTNV